MFSHEAQLVREHFDYILLGFVLVCAVAIGVALLRNLFAKKGDW